MTEREWWHTLLRGINVLVHRRLSCRLWRSTSLEGREDKLEWMEGVPRKTCPLKMRGILGLGPRDIKEAIISTCASIQETMDSCSRHIKRLLENMLEIIS